MHHPKSLSNIVKAKDYKYFDKEGKEYIDLESGIWCASLGHSHPKIAKMIQNQAFKLIHTGTKLKPEFINEIAKKVLDKADMKGKVFFMNTGSEAIDFAITLAKLKNEEAEISGFTDNYLGAYGQISEIKSKIDIKRCMKCTKEKCKSECPAIKDKIPTNGILIFDPFCFARQVFEIPAKLIDVLKSEIKRKRCLLVLDEITAGLGRTGEWFGFQHYNLKPDLVILGKTLGNGYPVSAILIDKKIADLVEKENFVYAQSHQNDPLGCQIAGSVIDTLESEQLIESSKIKGEELLGIFKAELSKLEAIEEIRGKGLMLAIEIKKIFSVENIYKTLIKKGVVIGISTKYNILNVFPAYTIPESIFYSIAKEIKGAIVIETNQQKEISTIKLKSLSYKY